MFMEPVQLTLSSITTSLRRMQSPGAGTGFRQAPTGSTSTTLTPAARSDLGQLERKRPCCRWSRATHDPRRAPPLDKGLHTASTSHRDARCRTPAGLGGAADVAHYLLQDGLGPAAASSGCPERAGMASRPWIRSWSGRRLLPTRSSAGEEAELADPDGGGGNGG